MKRPSDDGDERSAPSDSKAEEFVSRFLRRHPRFFVYVSIGIGALIVIAFIVAKLSSSGR
jgi:hypothetical protein